MKTLYIKHSKQQRYVYLLLGVMFLMQGVINLLNEERGFSFWFGFFQIGFSIFCFLYAYSIIKAFSINPSRIVLGSYDITLHQKVPFNKPKTIPHSEIKLIQLKPEQLTVMTKEFDFTHSINYEAPNKEEIMNELEVYANEKKLPIERVSYRNI